MKNKKQTEKKENSERRSIIITTIIVFAIIILIGFSYELLDNNFKDIDEIIEDQRWDVCNNVNLEYENGTKYCYQIQNGRHVKYKIENIGGNYSVSAVPIIDN